MVSDQAEALFKSDMFDEVKDRSTKIKFKAPSKDPQNIVDQIPSVQFNNKEVLELDTTTMIVSIGNGIHRNGNDYSIMK